MHVVYSTSQGCSTCALLLWDVLPSNVLIYLLFQLHPTGADGFSFLSIYGQPYLTFQPHLNMLSFNIPLALLLLGGIILPLYTLPHLHRMEYMQFLIMLYEDHYINFQTFFVWGLLLIIHTWNSSPHRSNLLRVQCTCCTVPTTSRRPHGSPLVWACQWPSSQPLSSPQLSHNDSLWP